MDKDPIIYILHINEAISAIEEFCNNLDEENFKDSILHQSAIVRQLEIIGEATKNVSSDFRNKYPKIPWKEIAGLRDKIIHHYFDIDLERIWNVIKKDLPELKKEIEIILQKEKI